VAIGNRQRHVHRFGVGVHAGVGDSFSDDPQGDQVNCCGKVQGVRSGDPDHEVVVGP
jgi:hypothetical protein